ncbi:11319_t:CDS:2 [Ambispora leptoticha]|uniref:11319_t:CDS:1 n=1 Tax=Ambispora leptoticha TaxID=144679 RepID=A0A9N8Z1B4_9GLOM|nr:11319_t:CDS:2 [Ambispora leptoticha]
MRYKLFFSSFSLINHQKYNKKTCLCSWFHRSFASLRSNEFTKARRYKEINDGNDDYDVRKTHYIPGKYLHFLDKPVRTLKKEAREEKNKPTKRIRSRELKFNYRFPSDHSLNQEEFYSNYEDKFSTETSLSSMSIDLNNPLSKKQQNISNRVSRAIKNCFYTLPHKLLGPSYVKIVNVETLTSLRETQIWWRPMPDNHHSKADIEEALRSHQSQLREAIKREMRVRKPPRLIFLRDDLANGPIKNILNEIMDELSLSKDQSSATPTLDEHKHEHEEREFMQSRTNNLLNQKEITTNDLHKESYFEKYSKKIRNLFFSLK